MFFVSRVSYTEHSSFRIVADPVSSLLQVNAQQGRGEHARVYAVLREVSVLVLDENQRQRVYARAC